MKHIYSICAIALLLCACNKNTPEPMPDHQPKYPYTWNPQGKMYICDRSDSNPYEYDYFISVILFTDEQNGVQYGTINRDLSPMDDYYNPFDYSIEYPKLNLIFGLDISYLNFIDTLTLRWESCDLTYTLH